MKKGKMNKLIAMLLSVMMLLSFAACGSEKEENDSDNAEKHGADYGSMQDAEADNSDVEETVKLDGNMKVGDYIKFGKYEQDNNTSNGKEDIEWLVLEVQSDRALLISKYIIDGKRYNEKYVDVTWETSTLRSWLSNTFYNEAFSDYEKKAIKTTSVTNTKNPEFDTDPGKETQDKVFALSIDEAEKYFSSDSERECKPTPYAEAQGAFTKNTYRYNGNGYWWLRSPGSAQDYAACVDYDGAIRTDGVYVYNSGFSPRPAIWVNIG